MLLMSASESLVKPSKTSIETSKSTAPPSIKLKVVPAAAASSTAPTLPESSTTTKELTEYVIHVHVHASAATAPSLLVADSLLTAHIVSASFVGVHEGLVCRRNFLELLLGCLGIVLVFVGVEFDS